MHRHPLPLRLRLFRGLALWLTLVAATPLGAGEITLPLRLPIAVLQESLRSTLNMSEAQPQTEIFRQGDCRYIQLNGLQLETTGDRLRVRTHTRLKFGPDWFGSCYGAVAWQGEASFDLEPYITPEQLLRYRLLDTQLVDEQGKKSLAADLVWKLVARIMQPRLEAFQIDLRPPRNEVVSVLHNFIPQAQVAEIEAVLASAHTTALSIEQDDLNIPLVFDVPDNYLAAAASALPPGTAEAPLSTEELTEFERTTAAWDAFLVYIIRNLGLEIDDTDLRIRLLEILLDSRYQVVAILAGETDATADDPTRALFVSTWNDLHALIAEAGQRGLLRGRLLSYLSFLSAGDALFLLDQTAPGLGLQISENGLRRLARAMRPFDRSDPLQYDWNLDPFLQQLFDLERPAPAPAPEATPQPDAQSWLDFLIPRAHAQEGANDLQLLSDRLSQWVPATEEIDTYQSIVAGLLDVVRTQELERAQLSPKEAEVFRHMVPATALIESCWRQYVKTEAGIRTLRSPSGSVGLMQVNPAVWRGIFDVERLKSDAGYNAYAGTRILLRYLRMHARPIAARTGAIEDLARASYAAYNAGPRAAGRFLKSTQHPRVRQVDDKFWNYFRGIREGGQVDVRICGVNPPAS